MSKSLNTFLKEPTRYCYEHINGDRVMIYNGIKRASKTAVQSWVVRYKRRVMIFFDRDHNGDWRAALQEAEAYLMSVYSPGRKFGKPSYKLVKVKRPYSKDPNDLVERVQLTRFTGGYKFFDLDPVMPRDEAILRAYYEAEDFHYSEGMKLGYIKAKPNTVNLKQLRLFEERYG